ncbi:MAG: hypothetical protein AB4426_23420 [Xenococcaceae cyanobacterium]
MNSQNSISIYEFSRGFSNAHYSEQYQTWVSEEPTQSIDRENFPVPQPIQEAVENGDFAINDNYPPESDEFALIARNIGKYSVLAVATGEIDAAGRPLVAYRYFWLERFQVRQEETGEETELDGIGTLLGWWYRASQPRYHLDENQNLPIERQKYPVNLYLTQEFDSYFPEVAGIFSQITYLPDARIAEKNNDDIFPQPLAWHSLVLGLQAEYKFQERYQIPISWAWNVRWLDRPERFALILSADKQANQYNLQDLKRSRKELVAPVDEVVYELPSAIEESGQLALAPAAFQEEYPQEAVIIPETTYEFSQEIYRGEIGQTLAIAILRKGDLSQAERVTLNKDNNRQEAIEFFPGEGSTQVQLEIPPRTSQITLSNQSSAEFVCQATIIPDPVYEFSQNSYRGKIGESVTVTILRKGDLSQDGDITVVFDNKSEIISFLTDEEGQSIQVKVNYQTERINLQKPSSGKLGNIHTAIITPEKSEAELREKYYQSINQPVTETQGEHPIFVNLFSKLTRILGVKAYLKELLCKIGMLPTQAPNIANKPRISETAQQKQKTIDIRILGPRTSGKTTYLATLARLPNWQRLEVEFPQLTIEAKNENAEKLEKMARDILEQGSSFTSTSRKDGKEPDYYFQIAISAVKRLPRVLIELNVKDFGGEIFEDLSRLEQYLNEHMFAAQGWMIMLTDWEEERDADLYLPAFKKICKAISEKESQNPEIKNLRLAVVMTKCERGEIWPGRLYPDEDLFAVRLPETYHHLTKKFPPKTNRLKFFACSSFGVLSDRTENFDPRPNRYVSDDGSSPDKTAYLRNSGKWNPFGLIAPLYWLSTGKTLHDPRF